MRILEDIPVRGKTVFLRVDFNVPLTEEGKIRDDTRIKASLPTIIYLHGHGARLVIASHLGRPKGKTVPSLSLKPVAERLSELLSRKVTLAPGVAGGDVDSLKSALQDGDLLLLENIRFDPGETANDRGFAEKLASGIDVYVNDAFGASHRAHASVVGITEFVPLKAQGYLLKKEVDYLSKALLSPQKPYAAVLGGAKVSDKIPIIENLLTKADDILIGGAMAYTFFKAQGQEVGRSLVEDDKLELARKILGQAETKKANIHLPLDHACSPSLESAEGMKTVDTFPLPADMMAVDIGPKTIEKYSGIIRKAKTIVWNGPLGVFEVEGFARGTMAIAEAVAASGGLSIIGGGDSLAAVKKAGVADRITHISTGGGASLEFLAKETLPGLEALGWRRKD